MGSKFYMHNEFERVAKEWGMTKTQKLFALAVVLIFSCSFMYKEVANYVVMKEINASYVKDGWVYAIQFTGSYIEVSPQALGGIDTSSSRYHQGICIHSPIGKINSEDLLVGRFDSNARQDENKCKVNYYHEPYLKGHIEFIDGKLIVNMYYDREDQISISSSRINYGSIISGGNISYLFTPEMHRGLYRLRLKKDDEFIVYNEQFAGEIIYKGTLGEFTSGHLLKSIYPSLKPHEILRAVLPAHPNVEVTLENNSEAFEFNGEYNIKLENITRR